MERTRHPWNIDFTWSESAGPFTTITSDQATAYDSEGFFVFEDAFDADTIAALDSELAAGDDGARRFLEQVPSGRVSVAGLDTQIVAPHAVSRSAWVREFCRSAPLSGIAHDLLGDSVRVYWEQSVYKQPNGAEPVLWHQDNGYAYVEPQAYLTCWIALTDTTRENGCIAVMPKVHRTGTLQHRHTDLGEECWGDFDAAVDVPIRAGSIVVFTSLTPHATYVNSTDEVRKAYIVQYVPDGAVVLQGEPSSADAPRRVIQDDPGRQFLV